MQGNEKIPRSSLSYKLVPVLYRGYQYGLFESRQSSDSQNKKVSSHTKLLSIYDKITLRDREINHCNSRKILKSRQNKFELSRSLAQLTSLLFSNVRPSSAFNYLLWCYWFLGEHISDTNSFHVIMSGLLSWQQLLIKAALKPTNKETTRK